ncbi:MAG: hypothetical protein KDC99_02610 [Cyclobacteriaceae bacterium]|nr:hypothetical protein [Cyclobacteriaceae bacterium]
MIIRTVFDSRAKSLKYKISLQVLAASWHRYLKSVFPLEVVHIGLLPTQLRGFLDDIGALHMEALPNKNDLISKTSNTIQGLELNKGKNVLLIDNDTFFANSFAKIPIDHNHVGGSIPGGLRVTSDQWDIITGELKSKLLPAQVSPLSESVKAIITESNPQVLRHVYVNGGVLFIPGSIGFKTIWENHVARISNHFRNHPLKDNNVYGSNMAGLATAIAEYGKFSWLPIDFNYRPYSFALGLSELEKIKIIHLTNNPAIEYATSVTAWYQHYWDKFILNRLNSLKTKIGNGEYLKRMEIISSAQKKINELVNDFGISL